MEEGLDEVVEGARPVREALASKRLCDHCLGRLFSKLGHGLDNGQRGRAIRSALGLGHSDDCEVCRGLLTEVPKFAELALRRMGELEHDTFLIGTRVEPSVSEAEESLWVLLKAQHAEPIKSELNREVGKLVERMSGKPAEFKSPDITAVIDTAYDSVALQVAPLYIYGRYRKLSRGIPQTRWPCRWCQGKGCERCGFKGKMYETSVEELIASEVMRFSGGDGHALHGMGREDVDVLMLGRGRPFIVEISNPRLRSVDLGAVERAVNSSGKVEVSGLRRSAGAEVVRLKMAEPPKTYRVLARFLPPADDEKIKEVVCALKGREIAQRTPARVSHRRADKVRKRTVLDISLKRSWEDMAEFEITTEAGTYVKELLHGDEGRTNPSIAAMLNARCDVIEVDVVDIRED